MVCRRRDRRVVFVGHAWPGNRHDAVVFRETVPDEIVHHPRLIGDSGYQGVSGVGVPRRGPGIDEVVSAVATLHNLRKEPAVMVG